MIRQRMTVNHALTLAILNAVIVRAGNVVLALYALDLGASPVVIGTLAMTFSAIPTVLSWATGRIADRFGSRWLLIGGAAGAGFGVLMPYLIGGMSSAFISAMLIGSSFAIYNVSLQNLVGVLSSQNERARGFANFSLMMSLSRFIGPLIAGFSVDHFGHLQSFLIIGVMAVVPFFMAVTTENTTGGGRKTEGKSSGGGLRYMLKNAEIRRTLVTSSLMHMTQDLFQFYLPVYAHAAGLSASVIGIVLALNAAAAFVVRSLIPKLLSWWGDDGLLMRCFIVGAISIALVPLTSNGWVLGLVAFMFGIGTGCGGPVITMLMFSHSSEGRSGEALGLRMTVKHMSRVVGPLAMGVVGSAFGLTAIFLGTAGLLGLGGAVSRAGQKAARKRVR